MIYHEQINIEGIIIIVQTLLTLVKYLNHEPCVKSRQWFCYCIFVKDAPCELRSTTYIDYLNLTVFR